MKLIKQAIFPGKLQKNVSTLKKKFMPTEFN